MAKERINSRNKGNKAERDLAKQLGGWANKTFARTPSSGGLQWSSSFSKGDIVCTTEGHYFPFCIEVKHHKEISITELIVGRKKLPKVTEFWEQCTRDAKEAGKIPLLFMRYNGLPKGEWMVAMSQRTLSKLPFLNCEEYNMAHIWHSSLPSGISVVNSAMFFASNYKSIRKFLKTEKKWLKRW